MKAAKTFIVACGIGIIIALLGVALLQVSARHRSAALLSAALLRQASLRDELRRIEQKAADLERLHSANLATAAARRSGPPSSAPKIPIVSLGEVISKDPKLADLWVKSRAASLDKDYGPLFRNLELSPERIERLKQIMVDRLGHNQDIYDTAQQRGLTVKDPTVVALLEKAEDQARADETALLGEAGSQEVREYQRSLSVRVNFVQALSADVAFTDPLSFQQGEQLTRILANASPLYRSGGNVDLWHDGTVDWMGVDQQVQTVLTPAQFAAWQQNHARLDAQLQTSYSMAAKADGLSP